MSGNSLRDQLSGLMQARQNEARRQAELAEQKKQKRLAQQKASSKEQTEPKQVKHPRLRPMPGLPVSQRARKNRVLILCGETGSGKTTQLPKLCVLAGRGRKGMIAHTQPRRIAASSIAKRLAEETGTELGQWVGFKIRFTDRTQHGAQVKLMTDGILLAETQGDPLLKAYDTIIIDEAHERSINIDFLLGYLKGLLKKRSDLKVIVTSATIDSERFAKHFADEKGRPAPVLTVSGRTYPVEIRYRPIEDEDETDDKSLMNAISDACDELTREGPGDILVFLPGEREIREAAEALLRSQPPTTEILPLYARLSAAEQEKVFKTSDKRRIVLSTNVAETSITVPGIHYVVDTGLARVKRYSYRNKVDQLLIEPVSQASANQRSGRCGRVADGICIRLYSEEDLSEYVGSVQWVCRSPYRPNHKRKNWFIDFHLCETVRTDAFDPEQVVFATFRSGGKGGQNVNKVESGVRAIYLPTGQAVVCTEERSQYANKQKALSRLQALIQRANQEQHAHQKNENWRHHTRLERGNAQARFEGLDFHRV